MQELCQQKTKKAKNLANVKKYVDKTNPGGKKIYLVNSQKIMILHMLKALGMIGGKKKDFLK